VFQLFDELFPPLGFSLSLTFALFSVGIEQPTFVHLQDSLHILNRDPLASHHLPPESTFAGIGRFGNLDLLLRYLLLECLVSLSAEFRVTFWFVLVDASQLTDDAIMRLVQFLLILQLADTPFLHLQHLVHPEVVTSTLSIRMQEP
jgi:hypothetical protein